MKPARTASLASRLVIGSLLAAGLLTLRARRRAKPRPWGRFITVDGVRLHYTDEGEGPVVLFLHGNGATSDDAVRSGLLERTQPGVRFIAIDRPGFGFSTRPRGRIWTAAAQAQLLERALAQLGAEPALVIGHSWGALVAVELALRSPAVRGLLLLSGYFFATFRPELLLLALPATPVIGPFLRRCVMPGLLDVSWPLHMRFVFHPAPVPPSPVAKAPALQPAQIRAAAADVALLIPAARALARRYGALTIPTIVIAGAGDRIVSPAAHSLPLAAAVDGSDCRIVRGAGHMVHHSHPEAVLRALLDLRTRAGFP